MQKPLLLHITDFFYVAVGREYYREDLLLIERLRSRFDIVSAAIEDCERIERCVDGIFRRNTGPSSLHRLGLDAQNNRIKSHGMRVYNDLNAQGDFLGKQHLLELHKLNYPVIPTFLVKEQALALGADKFILKLLDGADSRGLRILDRSELMAAMTDNYIIQPTIDFVHEVSFYFIDSELLYACHTGKEKRWQLTEFTPTPADQEFARRFVSWNKMRYGIQRIDAARLKDDSLLLMEIEDHNPFLNLFDRSATVQQNFIDALIHSLEKNLIG